MTMAGDKPLGATVLSMIGGIFILFGGVAYFSIAGLFALLGSFPGMGSLPIDPVMLFRILGGIGIAIGGLIIFGGLMMYLRPERSTLFGVLVLILSLVSVITWGGFFLGLILALVGGILGIVFKPSTQAPSPAAPMESRTDFS